MTNFQVYRKTLSFSLIEFLVGLLSLVVLFGLATLGFVIFNRSAEMALIGLVAGFIVGVIAAILISFFVTNRIKAAQIAMMTKGVTEGALPDHTFKEGFNEIRGRFGKIAAFFAITGAIKGVFRQIGRGINRIGTAVGGEVGNSVTSAIDSAIQTLIGYLCDCCLGWILFRKDQNSFRAGCEGAAIFFKNGKTLFRNIGRIFGMGFLSFILIGGGIFGLSFFIFSQFPQMFSSLMTVVNEIATSDGGTVPEILNEPTVFMVVISAFLGIVLWSMLHGVIIRPFILVGVLRNFMAAGQKDLPTEQDFQTLCGKSSKFQQLYNKA